MSVLYFKTPSVGPLQCIPHTRTFTFLPSFTTPLLDLINLVKVVNFANLTLIHDMREDIKAEGKELIWKVLTNARLEGHKVGLLKCKNTEKKIARVFHYRS